MKLIYSNKAGIQARVIALYLVVFGTPAAIMLLGFLFGWWETLAKPAG